MRAEPHKGLASAWTSAAPLSRAGKSLRVLFRFLSRPSVLPVLQAVIAVLLALWIVSSLWRVIWSQVPEAEPLPAMTVLNPVSSSLRESAGAQVDIEKLASAQLFGKPGTTLSPEELAAASGRSPAMSEAEAARKLAGIEEGAAQTRLPLVLRGVVAASDAGLGQAVIEQSKRQDLYQVGDELPVNGEVTLAKVLPSLVVLDNGGRYEILRLFEEGGLSGQNSGSVSRPVSGVARRVSAPAPAGNKPGRDVGEAAAGTVREDAAAIAARYRDSLYRDPQSLADVVRISPAREGDRLLGYRIAPGVASREFTAMGFQTGDVVVAVNGLSLSETANLPRLHAAMRSAESASFDIQRKGETVTLSVDIGQSRSEELQ